jgi:hypothetical protein
MSELLASRLLKKYPVLALRTASSPFQYSNRSRGRRRREVRRFLRHRPRRLPRSPPSESQSSRGHIRLGGRPPRRRRRFRRAAPVIVSLTGPQRSRLDFPSHGSGAWRLHARASGSRPSHNARARCVVNAEKRGSASLCPTGQSSPGDARATLRRWLNG